MRLTAGPDKRIRSLDDNPSGKVVDTPSGRRWEWSPDQDDETGRRLKQLHSDELTIERSDVVPGGPRSATAAPSSEERRRNVEMPAPGKRTPRDAGGGFDPYDNPGKPGRR